MNTETIDEKLRSDSKKWFWDLSHSKRTFLGIKYCNTSAITELLNCEVEHIYLKEHEVKEESVLNLVTEETVESILNKYWAGGEAPVAAIRDWVLDAMKWQKEQSDKIIRELRAALANANQYVPPNVGTKTQVNDALYSAQKHITN
jgi:hypothetical protein